jgi:hypothetical protein
LIGRAEPDAVGQDAGAVDQALEQLALRRGRRIGVAGHLSRGQGLGTEQGRRRTREAGKGHVASVPHLRQDVDLAVSELQTERSDRIEHQDLAETPGLGHEHVRADDPAGRMP